LSVRLEEEQLQAFQYLVDNVLSLTREADDIVQVLARGDKGEADPAGRGGSKAARKSDAEDYLPKLK